ncbi:hypothetical protein PUN28_020344 [Cardiocondyla obscurior]|uniref:Uncharacterized protein n=1 Tax=Cardiocondyla obscurior TaxID=286306 RepID=A0AAW2E418_9HYME
MHWELFDLLFSSNRDMAKKRNEKIFLKFNKLTIWPKTKKIFSNLTKLRVRHLRIKCTFRPYSEPLFSSSRDMANKRKKILVQRSDVRIAAFKINEFGFIQGLLFSSKAEIWQKTKNILNFTT